MKARLHKVWRIDIASVSDEQLRDRMMFGNRRSIAIQKLPKRAEYFIEATGGQGRRAEKKALAMARDDGIENPIIQCTTWVNSPYFHGGDPRCTTPNP